MGGNREVPSSKKRSTWRAVVALALGCALLSGCTAPPDADGWTKPALPANLPHIDESTVLPFDQFELPREQREALQRGTALLLDKCLQSYGVTADFAGDYIPQESDASSPVVYQSGELFGTISAAQASEYGYAAPPGGPWVAGNGIYLSNPSHLAAVLPSDPVEAAKVTGVLYGPSHALVQSDGGQQALPQEQLPRGPEGALPPEGGCMQTVENRIDVPFVDTIDIQSDVWNLALDDDRVTVRNKAWSDCMRRAGFEYDRFDEGASSNAGTVTPGTIGAAEADVDCTQSSGWPATFYAVLTAYQEQAIAHDSNLFRSSLKAEQKRLDVVARLTSE